MLQVAALAWFLRPYLLSVRVAVAKAWAGLEVQ